MNKDVVVCIGSKGRPKTKTYKLFDGLFEVYHFIEPQDFDKYDVWGILGCIYFSNLDFFKKEELGEYVSDVCREILFSGGEITFTDVLDAYFFGDPDMLSNCLEKRRNECSFFFDIDGVLVRHSDHSRNYLENLKMTTTRS